MAERKEYNELHDDTSETSRLHSTRKGAYSAEAGNGDDTQNRMRDLIAMRAYELYEERGRIDGDDIDDWLRAEVDVRASLSKVNQDVTGMAKQQRRQA